MSGGETQPKRLNPEFSLLNEKNEAKKVETKVDTMKNRVELLKQQLNKEKEGIKKNKQLTKDAIKKKVEVNRIYQYKSRDNSDELQRIEDLRKMNQNKRYTHDKELQDIQKAVYLVKLDDVREAKNISMEHSRRIKEMDREFLSVQKGKKQKIADESTRAKERYKEYWKEKLTSVYMEQAQNIAKVSEHKENKKHELSKLEEEEIRLMEEINRLHSQEVETKKQYLAALTIPVKEVAEAMGASNVHGRKSTLDASRSIRNSSIIRHLEPNETKLPNARVNEGKLKLILGQLKNIEGNKSFASSSR